MDSELALQGLFLHLVRRGFPLTIRDYQDALRALQNGFGLHRRENLQWLCQALWARTEEEVYRLDHLFKSFPWPQPAEIEAITGRREISAEIDADVHRQALQPAPGGVAQTAREAIPALQFAASAETGLELPRARVPLVSDEPFILTARPLISARKLTIIWRRFRLALRTGPGVELDIAATVDAQCRQGVLAEPVLRPERRNQARLIVLVDASPSMVAWRRFNPVLAESLRESGLGLAVLYYFDNVPKNRLFKTDTLTHPVPLDEVIKQHSSSTLLIISDAGAARGNRIQGRIEATKAFLERVKQSWQPTVWVNPLPQKRWRKTSAQKIARLPQLAMFELNEDGLIKAIDVLRGLRSP